MSMESFDKSLLAKNDLMASDVDSELIEILSNLSSRVDARFQGWEYVLGLTGTDSGFDHIIQSKVYIPFILTYVEEKKAERELVQLAYKCLINISAQERGASALLESKKDFIKCLLHSICSEATSFVQSKCYILSNLSAHTKLDKVIVDVFLLSNDMLPKLMKMYCSGEPEVRSQYDFLTLVFANISRFPVGRRFFIEDADFLLRLLTFITAKESEVRRLGVALILRNCCLQIDQHKRLLNDLNILPHLLLPLMDSSEYEDDEMDKLPIECQCLEDTKERDRNASVRRVLIQALTALCYSETGWDYLQAKGVYYVVRDLHTWESDELVHSTIENLVTYLLVEQYSQRSGDDYSGEDPILIQQIEADIVRDLPDFTIK